MIIKVLSIAGLHPLVVAQKQHFVLTGNDLHLTLLTHLHQLTSPPTDPPSTNPFNLTMPATHAADGKKAATPHLLAFDIDLQSILFISRSMNKSFMQYIMNAIPDERQHSHPHPAFPQSNQSSHTPSSHSTTGNSFGSQVLKISETAISIRYRYVTSPIKEQTSRPLHLLPIELHIGLLSMASKSSVMTTTQPGGWAQKMDSSTDNSEKFHFVVENVKCVASSEMVVQALREVIELVDRTGEVLLKMRMVNTCEKYQTAIVMYTLMGKVGLWRDNNNGGDDGNE